MDMTAKAHPSEVSHDEGIEAWSSAWTEAWTKAGITSLIKDVKERRTAWAEALLSARDNAVENGQGAQATADAAAWYAALVAARVATSSRIDKETPAARKDESAPQTMEERIAAGLAAGRAAWTAAWQNHAAANKK